MLRTTSAAPGARGRRTESPSTSSSARSPALMGKVMSAESPTPRSPAKSPSRTVSALKTAEMLPLDAPSARRMPISLVRSSTEMWVMMPIMMAETMSETETKAMST